MRFAILEHLAALDPADVALHVPEVFDVHVLVFERVVGALAYLDHPAHAARPAGVL